MSFYDDEIDFRPYFLALRKNWWQIALITFLAAMAAFIFSILQIEKYQATAIILLTRTKVTLSLAEQFPTINEPIDSISRMNAMLSIAGGDSLAIQTLKAIRLQYPDFDLEVENLRNSVKITSDGDIIHITATHSDPDVAAAIANIWAQNAVTEIRYAYSGEQLPSEILAGLEPARQQYETTQIALESFLKESRVEVLQRQITEVRALLDELDQDRTWQISYNVWRMQKMDQVINQAEAIKQQLRSNNTSTIINLGNALAVLRLQVDAFRDLQFEKNLKTEQSSVPSSNRSPNEIVYDIQITELINNLEAGQTYQLELEQIVDNARDEKNKAETNLLELAKQSSQANDDEIYTASSAHLRTLQAQLEEEKARLNDLTSQRDLAWQAYQALAQKETEVRNNLTTSSSVVLASSAIPPLKPASRGVVRNTAIVGALGFILGIVWVFSVQWLRSLDEKTKTNH